MLFENSNRSSSNTFTRIEECSHYDVPFFKSQCYFRFSQISELIPIVKIKHWFNQISFFKIKKKQKAPLWYNGFFTLFVNDCEGLMGDGEEVVITEELKLKVGSEELVMGRDLR